MKPLILLLTLTMLACSHESPVDFVLTPKEPVVTEIPPTPDPTPQPIGPAVATITWDANTEADLAGYKLYYSTDRTFPDPGIDVGLVTTYTVDGLERGKTYYFAVTAYNTSGNESEKSETRQVFIPGVSR